MSAVTSLCVLIPGFEDMDSAAGFSRELHELLPAARIVTTLRSGEAYSWSSRMGEYVEIYPEDRPGLAQSLVSIVSHINESVLVLIPDSKGLKASAIPLLVESHRQMRADLIFGSRWDQDGASVLRSTPTRAYRWAIRMSFGYCPIDVFSPVILLSRFCYKNIPILSRGFDLQIELILQALDKNFRLMEVPVPVDRKAFPEPLPISWRERGRAVYLSFLVLRDYRPFLLFGFSGISAAGLGLLAGSVPIYEYLKYDAVRHLSLPVLAAALMVIAVVAFQVGLLLDSSLKSRRETYHRDLRRLFAEEESS